MSQPRTYRALWRCGYQSTWAEGQTDTLCFRCRLTPLSAGCWPPVSGMKSFIILAFLQVHSLLKTAKSPFNHQSIFLFFFFIQFYGLVCLFSHFDSPYWVLTPASASWLGQNKRLTHTILAIANKGRGCNPFSHSSAPQPHSSLPESPASVP